MKPPSTTDPVANALPIASHIKEAINRHHQYAKALEVFITEGHTALSRIAGRLDPSFQDVFRGHAEAFLSSVAHKGHSASAKPHLTQNQPASVQLPPPTTNRRNYAQVAATVAPITQHTPATLPRKPQWTPKPTPPPNELPPPAPPTRVFLRLDQDAPIRAADTSAIASKLRALDDSLVPAVKGVARVESGFAITPQSAAHVKALLDKAEAIKASFSARVEVEERWTGYVLKRIPRHIFDVSSGSSRETTISDITEAAKEKTGVSPVRCHWSHHERDYHTDHTAVVFFSQKVKPFEVYGSAPARPHNRTPPVIQCEACFGFHPTRTCSEDHRCARCTANAHQGPCVRELRCANCLGSHEATCPTCPLRPVPGRRGALLFPTEERKKQVRADNRKAARELKRNTAFVQSQTSDTSQGNATTNVSSTGEDSGPSASRLGNGDMDVDAPSQPLPTVHA